MPLLCFFVGIVMTSHITGKAPTPSFPANRIGNLVAYSFLLSSGGGCEVTEVLAAAGSEAVLPCKFNVLSSDPASVHWSKKG